MNYYICLNCGQKYCGWAENKFCEKCGDKLKEITGEEFYSEKKEAVVVEEEVKDR